MNVVANAGSVTGGVITSEDEQLLATAQGSLEDQGNQVAFVAAISPCSPSKSHRRR